MLKLKRGTAWTVPMLLQAALMSAGPLFASEQQSDEQAVAKAAIEAEIVDVKSDPKDDDGEDAEVRSNPPALKARVAKPRPTKTAPSEVPVMNLVRGMTGGRIVVKSADGKTFEFVSPASDRLKVLQENIPHVDGSKGTGAPRGITILRGGEAKTIESDDLDRLIGELTGRMKDRAQAEAPKFIIGVSVSEAPEVLMVQLDRSDDSAVVVDSVLEESPAEKAGVKKFDVILKAGGESISSPADLTNVVKSSEGKELTLTLVRTGKELTIPVTPRRNEQANQPIGSTAGVIHFGPGMMDRRFMNWAGESGSASLVDEVKALRKDVAELKKLVEELKAAK